MSVGTPVRQRQAIDKLGRPHAGGRPDRHDLGAPSREPILQPREFGLVATALGELDADHRPDVPSLDFRVPAGGRLLGEYDQAGTPLREYVWLGATPLAMFTPDPAGASNPPLVYYIHADHLGAPQAVLDRSGRLRWSWMTEPFGTTVPQDNPQGLGAFAFKLRLNGQYADAESGWNYSYFRDYDPSVGRFIQSDPIGLAGGSMSTYAYVNGNPVSSVDPEGLMGVVEITLLARVRNPQNLLAP